MTVPAFAKDPIYRQIQPLLFGQDPEVIHERTVHALHYASQIPGFLALLRTLYHYEHPKLHITLWEEKFSNPIGMAAGFDKDGRVFNGLFGLGFGFVEIGTVTPQPQPGNPRPRLFRLADDQALINRLGFNNQGVEALVHRVKDRMPHGILGINIGKNKDTLIENAENDYEIGLRSVYDHAHYIVVNVSSPNTEKLRALQEREALEKLIQHLLKTRQNFVKEGKRRVPLLLKIAPDLTREELEDIIEIVRRFSLEGVIATNTTLARNDLQSTRHTQETGGLSGRPLDDRSTEVIRILYQGLSRSVPIIGVGGVFTGQDAYEKIRAGASLVQLYTGMIYRGPAIAKYIKQELVALLNRDGFASITDAIGADH